MRKCEVSFFKSLALQASPAVVPPAALQEEEDAEPARGDSSHTSLHSYRCSPCFSMLESMEALEVCLFIAIFLFTVYCVSGAWKRSALNASSMRCAQR